MRGEWEPINKMVLAKNSGLMAATTEENTGMEKNVEKELTTGPMVPTIRGSGSQIKCMEEECLVGLMEESLKESLWWDLWMEKGYMSGKMEENT